MQLLSPEKVKKEEDTRTKERITRTAQLNAQETKAAKSLNETETFVAERKAALEDELSEVETKTAARKEELEKEIGTLEAQRKELLKPVDEILKNAQVKLEELNGRESTLAARELVVKSGSEELVERIEAVRDAEQTNEEKVIALNKREDGVAAQEKRAKESSNKLAEDWIAYHKAVHKTNLDLTRREKEVSDGEKANEIYRTTLEATDAKQRDEWKAIRSGYAALEEAKKHLGIT